MNMVGKFTGQVVDLSRAELPDNLKPGTSCGRNGIGSRNHTAEMRLANFSYIVLYNERIADGLHVDRHWSTVVRGSGSGCDVGMRAPLILRVRKMKEPICNVHFFDRRVDRGRDGGE